MARSIHPIIQINRLMLVLFIGFIFTTATCVALASGMKKTPFQVSTGQAPASSHREIVVLVHGLMRTSWSMVPLKFYLQRLGYQVYYYSYPSPKYTIKEHGNYLKEYIAQLLANNPGVKVDFITHSLGGIITREALSKLNSKQLKSVGCLIMLAPPNQGSKLAKLSVAMLPLIKSAIKPLAELSSDDAAYVHYVPVPAVNIGIIAGRYDAKVPPEYARLPGKAAPVVIDSNHTFIMTNTKTKELIRRFLAKGNFDG